MSKSLITDNYLTGIRITEPSAVWHRKDQVGLDPDTVMPVAGMEPGHQSGVAEPPVGQQANLIQAEKIKHPFDLCQQGKEMSNTDLCAGMFDDTGGQRYCPSPKQHRNPDETESLEQDAGVQRHNQWLVAPVLQRTGDQGAIDRNRIDGWVAQPSANSTLSALCKVGSGLNVGKPARDGGSLGTQ